MDTTEPVPDRRRAARGGGTQRERRPGVWEVRVPTGQRRGGRAHQRSYTIYGTHLDAAAARARLVTQPQTPPPQLITLGELLALWLVADHPWKPSTIVGYRSTVRALRADHLALGAVAALTPQLIRQATLRWQAAGAGPAVIAGRLRVVRTAIRWAYTERLIDSDPIRYLRGPGHATPRRPLPDDDVRALLVAAEFAVLQAQVNTAAEEPTPNDRHRLTPLELAEQNLLLVKLAADTGARRGELAALHFTDLDGRVLRIERAFSADVLTTPKSGHGRVLTLGCSTAQLWHTLADTWTCAATQRSTVLGPWVFSGSRHHTRPLTAGALGHRFESVRDAAGLPEATLHRLRHSVATFLVSKGQILQAQARLGHADAATTLREYSYALPLTDAPVADALEAHLNTPRHQIDPDQTHHL